VQNIIPALHGIVKNRQGSGLKGNQYIIFDAIQRTMKLLWRHPGEQPDLFYKMALVIIVTFMSNPGKRYSFLFQHPQSFPESDNFHVVFGEKIKISLKGSVYALL